jgi:RimJ/RimL family protein N-acetyltransferase
MPALEHIRRESIEMDEGPKRSHSQVFLVRLWAGDSDADDDHSGWHGRLLRLGSGETLSFYDWPALTDFLSGSLGNISNEEVKGRIEMQTDQIRPQGNGKVSTNGAEAPTGERPIVSITGEKVALGVFVLDHAPIYQRWMNHFDTLRRAGFPIKPMTIEQQSAALERWTGSDERIWFVIYEVATWRPIGITGLSHVDHCHRTAEFNICIGEPECRGKGYGTEVTRLVLDYAFTALSLHSVYLETSELNIPGQRAYRRAGFQEIGRRRQCEMQAGKLRDLIYMDCLASEFASPVLRAMFELDDEGA